MRRWKTGNDYVTGEPYERVLVPTVEAGLLNMGAELIVAVDCKKK